MQLRILAPIALLSLTIASTAHAENLQHLSRAMSSGECQKCDLSGSGLVLANLKGVDLTGSDLTDANLSRANLFGAKLAKTNLSRASLLGADLRGADLSGANLSAADLNGADLTGANLTGTNLNGADLRKATLTNANFQNADFTNAYFRGAIDIPAAAVRSEEFYAWGVEEARRGNHRGAIEQFNQSLGVDGKFAYSYIGRAISRKQLGDLQGAIDDSKLAETFFQEQKNEEGVKVAKDLTKALQTPPDSGGSDFLGSVINMAGSLLLKIFLH
ncbi:pentapeptide repeat-containing protein [Pseudanabaena sp. PCC 6802]|uniref:pentapeptide repeat-containing protein n=1 Tax=Pseudanabaena sp. PCC 6802 TaxID=118173 RepID=UPI0005687EDD|nr:pentapeptide repeat-containing protein [Pseudanabaena sp. PCC 6802]